MRMPISAPGTNTTHISMIRNRHQRRHRAAFSGVSRKVAPTGSTGRSARLSRAGM